MDPARRVRWTDREYLARERLSEARHEFFDGEIYAMAGATLAHNTLAANAIFLLKGLVRAKGCAVFTSDQRIHVPATGLYTYPDAGVLGGSARLHPEDDLTLLNPTLLVEVLSPSTETYDRGEKLQHYRAIPSLREVVLVASEATWVAVHRRVRGDRWQAEEYDEGAFELTVAEGVVALRDLYEAVDLRGP